MHHSFLLKSLKITISIQKEIRKVGSNTLFSCYYYSLKFFLLASRVGPRQVKLNIEELGEEGEEVFD